MGTSEEQALTEKLIGYDTSTEEGIKLCAGFVKGWLDSREIESNQLDIRGLPVTTATSAPRGARRCCCTATSTSCPAAPSSSSRGSTATASSAAAPTT